MFNVSTPARAQHSRAQYSRAQIETLCILSSVGSRGCKLTAVAERLGLSRSLAVAIADGLEPLLARGLLEQDDERVKLTAAGRLMLAEVL